MRGGNEEKEEEEEEVEKEEKEEEEVEEEEKEEEVQEGGGRAGRRCFHTSKNLFSPLQPGVGVPRRQPRRVQVSPQDPDPATHKHTPVTQQAPFIQHAGGARRRVHRGQRGRRPPPRQ